MPRYELDDDGVMKFWEVERDGTTFTAKWGKVGGSVSQRVYEYGDEAEADKEYDKHVDERLKKGYELVGGKPKRKGKAKAEKAAPVTAGSKAASNAELEAAIAEDPTNDEAYLVYADWLQGQGDPRGELITIQQQLATFPHLVDVKLRGGAMELGAIDLPNVETFTIITGGLSKKSLDAVLKQLTSLDLSMGTMSDAGAEALIAGAKAFAKLEVLSLGDNYLSEEMQKKVKAAIEHASVEGQREADDDGDGEVYRYTSIGE